MSKQNSRKEKVIVIGAGIVGASVSHHLTKAGAEVIIVDKTGIAAGATGKSFAWINAHHFKSETYHRLRYQSLAEYNRLDRELQGELGLTWCGALSFDALGEAFDQRVDGFRKLGYPIDVVSHNKFRMLEPNYGHPPGRALHLPMEAAIDPITASRSLIKSACKNGAQIIFGENVKALRCENGRVAGIETCFGSIEASHVVVAAGTGAEDILASANVALPMANRFGVMLHSAPVEPTLNHVIWGDRIHMKQQIDGRIIIGEVFSEDWSDRCPHAISEQMLADANRHLPDVELRIERITVGERPIPKDGMPVVGSVDGLAGLYIAVMHSGVTLAPIVGRMAADEILKGVAFNILDSYRLSRFQSEPKRT
jgi:glycine/D-amino acid oxidase-like deaminating enzyme